METKKTPEPSKEEILIVEDSPTQAEQLHYFLEREGFHVAVAYSGDEAFAYLSDHRPAIIISDIIMPGMDGFQLCQRIKENDTRNDIPVVLLTSLSDPQDIIKGLQCGASNFITKPYKEEFLLSRIKHILVNQELRKSSSSEMGIEIFFAGQKYFLTAERMQIIDLLISTYETAVQKNRELEQTNEELRKTQLELKMLNEHLEEKVKERTQRIERLNIFLWAIRSINQLMVRETDPQRLIQEACGKLTSARQDFTVWIALLDESQTVMTAAEGGIGNDFLPLRERLSEGYVPKCCQRALNQVGMVLIEDRISSCGDCPLASIVPKRGVICARLECGGKIYGVITITMPPDSLHDKEEQGLAEEVIGDIAFALHGIEVREQRKRAEESLKSTLSSLAKSLDGIVQVVAMTVETRDPYTAGHQRRVANLARAIAQEMELSEKQQEGIYMAGTIHDLGKLSVPAEILSKPTRLTEIEFKLIQVHPQIGYDILKGFEFPWPIAQIVYQHHERMNGSGYPLGIEGDAILLEARVLTVADVVEAMASHRPYRPALGIDKALEEITENRGVLYDPIVVDACRKIFAEKKFMFE